MDIGQMLKDFFSGAPQGIKDVVAGSIEEQVQGVAGSALETVETVAGTVGLAEEVDTLIGHAESAIGLDLNGDGEQ